MSETEVCTGCGRLIRYITTEYGKRVPCGSESLWVIRDTSGGTYYDEDGRLVRGHEVRTRRAGATLAYAPHRGSCPNAAFQSKAKRYNEREKAFREKVRREREEREKREARRAEREARAAAEEEARKNQYSMFASL